MKNAKGAVLGGLLFLVILISVGFFFLYYTFGYVIPPGQMGLRQITFGPKQGFSNKALEAGYHWSIPIYSKVHFIPRTVQILNLHREHSKEDDISYGAPLEVQTKDGSSVDVDITTLARFLPDTTPEHGGPAELIKSFGTDEERWKANIITVISNELKKSLGRLSTSDFYDPFKREKQVEKALEGANERLLPNGIKVDALLLRRYTYKEARIDDAIFQKNLQDQEERWNMALSLKAEAKAELEQVSAEWDAKIATLRVQGDNKASVTRSQASLYETVKISDGDLLVAKAQAEVDRLKASALASAQGADVYVGRQLAPLLSSLKGGVINNVDPYNLEEWQKKMGVN